MFVLNKMGEGFTLSLWLIEDLTVVLLWIYSADSVGERKSKYQGAFLYLFCTLLMEVPSFQNDQNELILTEGRTSRQLRCGNYSKSVVKWLFLVLCCKFHKLEEQ